MNARSSRGFTLIELMISVAIVGILSSVAIPEFQNATLRSRKSERDMIVDAVNRSMQSLLVKQGKFSPATQPPGTPFVGAWNPPLPLSTQKRTFDPTMTSWNVLDLQIDGQLYHSYQFITDETASPATMDIMARGDLDGDGVAQQRTSSYKLVTGVLLERQPDTYDPPNDVAF
jgi:prepilin-type N-terminal cleavage/methylation domain-containing protein